MGNGEYMNWLFIVVLCIFLFSILNGYRIGFFKSVVFTGSIILALFLTSRCYSYVSILAQKYTKIDETVSEKIVDSLEIETDAIFDSKASQIQAIEDIILPDTLKSGILDNNNHEVYAELGVEDFLQYIGGYLAVIVVNAISFICTFVVLFIILLSLCKAIGVFTEIPILKSIDKVGGILLGGVRALIHIWIGFIGITMLGSTTIGMTLFNMIQENALLTYIYDNNLLLKFITDISKVLFQ